MSSPMTLREALGIVLKSCGEFTNFPDSKEDIERANAIVDAAVEAHEERIKCQEVQDAEPFDGEAFRVSWERLCDLDDKLRALERGEGEVQP